MSSGRDDVDEFLDVASQGVLVDAVVQPRRAGRHRLCAIQMIVETLRDLEEPRVAFDHEPTRVDPTPRDVCEQRLEHLGNAAARRGRVHVQDRAPVEVLPRGRRCRLEPFGAFGTNQHLEPIEAERSDIDTPQSHVDQHPPFGTHYESPIDIMLAKEQLRTDDARPRHRIRFPCRVYIRSSSDSEVRRMWNAHSSVAG